jgi:hypothetical protein
MFNISFDKGVLAFLTGIGGAMMRESNVKSRFVT